MNTSLSRTLPPVFATPLAKPGDGVSCETVLRWMRIVAPYSDYHAAYPEIATAISNAANLDPLWAEEGGRYATAALLVSFAYTQSGFHPNLVGRGAMAFGLFQVELPRSADATVFLLPHTACLAVIDMLRQALDSPGTLEERLLWYDEARTTPGGIPPLVKSRIRLELAQFLLAA